MVFPTFPFCTKQLALIAHVSTALNPRQCRQNSPSINCEIPASRYSDPYVGEEG
jgi:hypothetical protein